MSEGDKIFGEKEGKERGGAPEKESRPCTAQGVREGLPLGTESEDAGEELLLTVGPTDSPAFSHRPSRLYKYINSQKAMQRFQSSFTLWVLELFLLLILSATPPQPDTFLTPSGFSNLGLGGGAISTSHLPLPISLSLAYHQPGF